MTEDDESGPLPEGAEGKSPRMVDFGLSGIERGATLDTGEDAMEEAANTSLEMEGFETGSGFDLEGKASLGDPDFELETPELDTSVPKAGDFEKTGTARSAGRGLEDLVADGDYGGAVGGARRSRERVDLTIPEPDDSSLTPRMARPKKRHRGLEALARRRRRRTAARWLVRAAAAVLVFGGGGFALVYWDVVEIPGVTLPERARSGIPAPVALAGAQPETPVMSHVLLVDTWREIQTPLAMADALRDRMPNLLGFVTALRIDGDRQFALMVGPAYSAVEANRLKVPLGVAFDLLNPDPESWSVLEAAYSFFLGEYETVEEANDRARELADLSVPAFVLQVDYAAEPRGLRVYGGAFTDEVQARGMGRLLRENGLGGAPLIERRGRLPR